LKKKVDETQTKSKSAIEKFANTQEVQVMETLNEVGIYLQRTLQLIWLAFKVGFFNANHLELTDVSKL